MSIITGRGDDGETDLLFGRRISKTSQRIEVLGTVDELNAALGLARAAGATEEVEAIIDRVQDLRVERAKRLLESTDTPVEGVSAEVGYEDPSFFRRVFRRRTGLTPGAYRRMFDMRGMDRA